MNPATTADSRSLVSASNSRMDVPHHASATPNRVPARSHRPSTARAAPCPQGAATATWSPGGGPDSHHRSVPVTATRCSGQSNCGGSRRQRLVSVPLRPSAPSSSSAPSASSSQTATADTPNLGASCPASAPTSSTPSLDRTAAATASGSSAASSRSPAGAGAWSAESGGHGGSSSSDGRSPGADSGSWRSTAAAISVTGMPAAAAMSASCRAAVIGDSPSRSISTPRAIAATSAACASARAEASSRRWRSITAASLGKLSMGSTLGW